MTTHRRTGNEARRTETGATADPDVLIEAYGRHCGLLEPLLRERLEGLESGQVVEIRADDPSVPDGIASWSRLTGNELVVSDVADDGNARLRVQKK
ncbi:MAG: sulfurtransferase TusA family protein [Salinigranum sp.]